MFVVEKVAGEIYIHAGLNSLASVRCCCNFKGKGNLSLNVTANVL